jgi:tRNA A37 methylthiotransferase MiaB
LGQNVNSFLDQTFINNNENKDDLLIKNHKNSEGFKELYKIRNNDGLRFTDLIHKLSLIAPEVRFRFTSPHPKDFPEELISLIKESNNICKQ